MILGGMFDFFLLEKFIFFGPKFEIYFLELVKEEEVFIFEGLCLGFVHFFFLFILVDFCG